MSKSKTLVSVIVPAYKVEDFLPKCIESILAQSYKNLEIILIEDGSPDACGKICDEYAKKDKRIIAIHQKNKGLSAVRNLGIKKASGDFICFVDSDDYIDREYVARLVEGVTSSNGVDIAVCGFNEELPDNKVISGADATIGLLVGRENIDIVSWNKLYRKSLFTDNNIWFPVGRYHEDALTTYKLYSKSNKVSYIDKSLYHYVIRDNSIMTSSGSILRQLKEGENAAREAVSYFDKADSDALKDAASYSLCLARFRFIDCAISKRIDVSYFGAYRDKVLASKYEICKNKFARLRVKIYLCLLRSPKGFLYRLFRLLKHD